MTETIWFYDKAGHAAFYRVGDNAYKDGKRLFWISGGNWYSNASGQARRAFYESGKWLINEQGVSEFYRA
ncbi:hypothetical protein [Ruixingdingia sedimenti]|uniref:Uncharacterized protein n=1 Tax=Ruixingdingia sedimenti TaxID=3073604 RepID=A0ABU1F2A0_9RHOB|nr:hypothetical protein [Xinfangfangia sp. LG-4]MDR5650985.1 hypothetical protein [Xinfangfangia sp. LG-4]